MKLLIVGNVPKEYGGTYTTGVTNVIIRISEEFDRSNTNYHFIFNRAKLYSLKFI